MWQQKSSTDQINSSHDASMSQTKDEQAKLLMVALCLNVSFAQISVKFPSFKKSCNKDDLLILLALNGRAES